MPGEAMPSKGVCLVFPACPRGPTVGWREDWPPWGSLSGATITANSSPPAPRPTEHESPRQEAQGELLAPASSQQMLGTP